MRGSRRIADECGTLARAMTRSIGLCFGVVLASSYSTSAWAHIALSSPPARYGQDFQKEGPCGMAGNPPGTNPPTELTAGAPLMVTWDEFVDHDGHFRISISNEGDDAFLDPTAFDDFYNSPTVILDEIVDVGEGMQQAEIEVPDIPCNPCTLQLMQVMYGGQFGAGALYYQCADIVINGSSAETTGTAEESSGGPTDESTGGGESSSEGGSTVSATGDSATTTADSSATNVDPSLGTGEESTGGSGSNDDTDGGCGCTTDRRAAPFAWLAIAGLALLHRRRR